MKQCRIFTQRQAKEDTSKNLSVFPATGGLRYFYHTELHGLRILPLPKFEKYLLFYRFNEDEHVVEIVRIVHGARDIPSLF